MDTAIFRRQKPAPGFGVEKQRFDHQIECMDGRP